MFRKFAAWLVCGLSVCIGASMVSVRPGSLKTEGLRHQGASDVTIASLVPRLSWQLDAGLPDTSSLAQQSYQIIVERLVQNDAPANATVLWDTQRVASNQTLHVVYAGIALRADDVVRWKVRVWGISIATGKVDAAPSGWSEGALVRVGRLSGGDWTNSEWIISSHPGPNPTNSCALYDTLRNPLLRRDFSVGEVTQCTKASSLP